MGKSIYLLTGATGNLGSNIAYALVKKGEKVRALVRNPSKARLGNEIEIIEGDLLNIKSLEKFFSVTPGIEIYVIHCASEVTVEPGYNQLVHDANISGTRNIIDQCRKINLKKLVYISSTGAIPELPGNTPIVEVDEFSPDLVEGYYSKSKAAATQLVADAVKLYDIDASIVFPSGIMGPYDYRFGLVTKAIVDFVSGRIPCAIEGTFNCTDARDLADGIITCCKKGRKGEGYIMANGTVTMRELFDVISDTSGCRRIGLILPAWLAKAFAFVAESYGRILGRPVLFTRFTIYNLVRNNNFSSEKARVELNYKTRPFAETIRDEVLWLRSEGKIK